MRPAVVSRCLWALTASSAMALTLANESTASPDSPQQSRSAAPAANDTPSPTQTTLIVPHFGTVTIYRPAGPARSVAIFISGDGGWQLGVVSMAKSLAAAGAVVIGVDVRQYLRSLRAAAASGSASCRLIAGDFEDLSHRVQKRIGMEEYHVPVLVGYSSGATIVYAVLVQSPSGTFAGAMSLGFCPDQDFGGAALCPGAGLHYTQGKQHELVLEPARTLKQPWIALQGQQDVVCSPQGVDDFAAQTTESQVVKLPKVGHGFGVERNWLPQFVTAYGAIVERVNAPRALRPAEISDLPVNVVTAQSASDAFAMLLTGDGGWAGLDQELAARLAAAGIPTVSLNSLKYFWTRRSADEAAKDVGRIMSHYLATWNKKRALLVGYSFGADVLPFVVNRLPQDLRSRVATINLLGIDSSASFEISVADWIGHDPDGQPTQPELTNIIGTPVLCIYGAGETDSICPGLVSSRITKAEIGSGHHFGGEYAQLADRIVTFARAARPMT